MRFEIPLTDEQYQKARAKFWGEDFKCSGCGTLIRRKDRKVLFAQPKVANEWGAYRVLAINATCESCATAFAEFMKSRAEKKPAPKPCSGCKKLEEARAALRADLGKIILAMDDGNLSLAKHLLLSALSHESEKPAPEVKP